MQMTILLVIQVLLACAIIGLILIQQGKGAATGAAFGSGASSTVFGARGSASFLTRTTAILAILFFSNSFLLSYLYSHTTAPKSLMERAVGMSQPAADADKSKTKAGESTSPDLPPDDAEKTAAAGTPAPKPASESPAQNADTATPPTDMPPVPAEEQPATQAGHEDQGSPAPKN